MTKRDYEALAAALRDTRPVYGDERGTIAIAAAQWQEDVAEIASALSRTSGFTTNGNRRFDRDRFLAACGYPEET